MSIKYTPELWFIALALITCGLALGLPPDPHTLHQLHISSISYRIAVLVLLVPYGVIWYAAFYAFTNIKSYSQAIKGFTDGQAFHCIMIGTGVLAYGLMAQMAASLLLQNIAIYHHGFRPASVIMTNYFGILVGLLAFLSINSGTHRLIMLGKKYPGITSIRSMAILFIALASAFTYQVISYHSMPNRVRIYYLTTPLLITTFIIPNLFGWFTAILSAYEFWLYATFAKGLLYRKFLRLFSYGIVVAIAGSVASQFVTIIFGGKVRQSIGSFLLVDYTLLIIVAVGLTLMALGAQKLKRIEEV